MDSLQRYSAEDLKNFIVQTFVVLGVPEEDAFTAADVLVLADLRGIDSHGIARLEGYIRLIEKGRVNVKPQMKWVHTYKSNANLDADGALGLVSAPFAMKKALALAKEYGSGWIAIQNSNHFGIAAYHALMASDQGYIGYASTNASPLVTPAFGKERMLGTNPICYAIPAGKYRAFVLDMATSAAANGKLEIAERAGKALPEGWVINKEGQAATQPNGLKEGGMLLPLGSDAEHGMHKGYGLGAMVDIMSGVLGGANYGPWVPPFVAFLDPLADQPGKGIGHFLGAWSLEGFTTAEQFEQRMEHWISRFKQTTPLYNGTPVKVAGEPEFEETQRRNAEGIPLYPQVVESINRISKQYNLKNVEPITS